MKFAASFFTVSERLDQVLVNKGMFPTRSRATLAIERELVKVNGSVVTQKSFRVKASDEVELIAEPLRYVGLGGEKLEPSLRAHLPPNGFHALDIGCGTGGFTDCLLQHGAGKVIAVDIGNAQIHFKLASDSRVEVFENTDIRTFNHPNIKDLKVDVITIDVSFISLETIIPIWQEYLKPGALVFALFKPQFELGKRVRLSGGILKSETMRQKLLAGFKRLVSSSGFTELGVFPTQADGKTKNIEFMTVWCYDPPKSYKHAGH
jgi:23S rRNA (cytidine1920-2'-O)/16S rRNA (cytidine1409-2'-O)-methyltransferase